MSDAAATILAAFVAALVPSALAFLHSRRTRREARAKEQVDFGTDLAKTAFRSMEIQVARLSEEQLRYEEDRRQWARDKAQLLARIEALTHELQQTNAYLAKLRDLLDEHAIPRPAPPSLSLIRHEQQNTGEMP